MMLSIRIYPTCNLLDAKVPFLSPTLFFFFALQVQNVVYIPGNTFNEGDTVQCTYISIPQVFKPSAIQCLRVAWKWDIAEPALHLVAHIPQIMSIWLQRQSCQAKPLFDKIVAFEMPTKQGDLWGNMRLAHQAKYFWGCPKLFKLFADKQMVQQANVLKGFLTPSCSCWCPPMVILGCKCWAGTIIFMVNFFRKN